MSWHHVKDTKQKARKVHTCYLCGESIEKGQEYLRRFGYDEEGPVSECMHPECVEVTRSWSIEDWEVFSIGEFQRPKKDGSL